MPLKECCLSLDYGVSIWYTGQVTLGLFLSAGTFYEWVPPQLIRWPLHSQSDQGWILIWHCVVIKGCVARLFSMCETPHNGDIIFGSKKANVWEAIKNAKMMINKYHQQSKIDIQADIRGSEFIWTFTNSGLDLLFTLEWIRATAEWEVMIIDLTCYVSASLKHTDLKTIEQTLFGKPWVL